MLQTFNSCVEQLRQGRLAKRLATDIRRKRHANGWWTGKEPEAWLAHRLRRLPSLPTWACGLRTRLQRPLILFALLAVAAGCFLALDHLDLRWSDVNVGPLLAMVGIVVPLSLAYSALNMMLMGRA